MSSPESGEQPLEIDPTIRIMRSEFELGIDCNHVFGEEPVSSQQYRDRTGEERNKMIVEFDENGVHVEFEEPDGTRHP